jgi:hypothetical protein
VFLNIQIFKNFSKIVRLCRAQSLIPQGDESESAEQTAEEKEQERIDKIIPDKPVTDEEIAELLSGEAEVLKDGVIGYASNFFTPSTFY